MTLTIETRILLLETSRMAPTVVDRVAAWVVVDLASTLRPILTCPTSLGHPPTLSLCITLTPRTNHCLDRPGNVVSGNAAASSEDGSGDEGVTVHVDSPLVANGSSRSSPVKQVKE